MSRQQISRAAVVWQLLAFLFVVAPHLIWLPIWLDAVCLATAGARLMIHGGRWPLPHWSVKVVLILIVAAGLMATFGRADSMHATVALLIAGLGLKMLEIYHRRDALVLLYVALFVLATSFLFSQSIAMALYALLALVVVITALGSIYQDPLRTDLLRPLRRTLRLVGFALPLMLVLFVLFPRIAPLWSVPLNRQVARSGLSDRMAPGDISNLIKSDALAFRVAFDAEPPPPAQRYWRVMVYSRFDGRTWSRAGSWQQGGLQREVLQPGNRGLGYEVIMEPTEQRWLAALDQPLTSPTGMHFGSAHTLVSDRRVDRRIHYRLQSATSYRLQPVISARQRDLYLQLPPGGNPRSRAQAALWWQQAEADPQRFVRRVLQSFHDRFTYTLTPPPLSGDTVDQFLFQARRGFCGHYAGALTFLLRSVGVPARVVAGYQGGEWNPYEHYLSLRQYDAHAWTEYWLPGQGWVRVDPTAAVAPQRVVESADQVFGKDPAFLPNTAFARLGHSGWLLSLRQQMEAVNFAWNRWVLHYQGQQMALLGRWFGELNLLKLILALLLPSAFVMAVVAWQQLYRPGQGRRDPVHRSLQRLLSMMARRGLARRKDESLQRYAVRIRAEESVLARPFQRLAQADEALRYAEGGGDRAEMLEAIKACRRALRKLGLKKEIDVHDE